MDISSSSAPNPEAPTIDPATQAIIDGWVNNEIDSATAITDPEHPFFVHSNNASTFKYKYPEAKPTPPGEDDVVWNRTYTAADSRMYNKNGKDHNNSRKIRASGETYTLSLQIHWENKQKYAKKCANPLDPNSILVGKAAPKPKVAPSRPSISTTMESPSRREDSIDGVDMSSMSISEKIKSREGKRKVSSTAVLALQSSPGPISASPSVTHPPSATPSSVAVPVPKPAADPTSPDTDKAKAKKKSQKKKTKPKKAVPAAGSSNVSLGASSVSATQAASFPSAPRASNDSDSDESNDGGEYCICRGPDDHRMMIFCDGPCQDWYHCECIKVDEADSLELLDRFICSNCTTPTMFTTWKPMCRNYNLDNTHRKAARVNENSKYCSEKCATEFWEFVGSKLRPNDEPSMGGALSRKEAAMLLHSVKTAEGLHALGEKPRLPAVDGRDPDRPAGLDYVTKEEQKELDDITAKMATLQDRIENILKQLKLLDMVQERYKIAAKHPNLTVANICGYDSRLALNEWEFRRWSQTEEAKEAFSSGYLGPRSAETKAIGAIVPHPGQLIPPAPDVADALQNICLNKAKGCRHNRWYANHKETMSYEIAQLRVELKVLRGKEMEIIEDAETREATKSYHAHNKTTQLL